LHPTPQPPKSSVEHPIKPAIDRKRVSIKKPAPPLPPSPPPAPSPLSESAKTHSNGTAITATELLDEDDPDLSKIMGFTKFTSTKGKKHDDYGGIEVRKKRSYRQYMNRPGGFNRPLD
jgi:U4/U6.U5 tri-snRNP-associated protein 3